MHPFRRASAANSARPTKARSDARSRRLHRPLYFEPLEPRLVLSTALGIDLNDILAEVPADKFAPQPASSTIFTVSSIADAGPGSLREAINAANANAGLDTIAFDLAGSGPHSIQLNSPLPFVLDPVIIDGTTEPDFAGTPMIELDGSNAGAGADGLTILAGSSTVRGLVINRFSLTGISLFTNGGNVIEGNYLGTDVTGSLDLGNSQYGVAVWDTSNNTIGGENAAARNLISGNDFDGVILFGANATGNVVAGNYIGTDVSGSLDLGNAFHGVSVHDSASNNSIGGIGPGAGNTIAFNGVNGVWVNSGNGNAVLSNAIFANVFLGIDLGPFGVTLNDAGDADTGANDLQNAPVLTSTAGGSITITGSLNSEAQSDYRIEFFSNEAADATGYGEGQTFLGAINVTTDNNGDASFTPTFAGAVPLGHFITATATNLATNSTSEFSAGIQVALSFRKETGADEAEMTYGVSGAGVTVVIMDRGIDWDHPDFINPDGTTRIKWLLDMSPEHTQPMEYSEADINAALTGGPPINHRDAVGHGTLTAGVAAGNGSAFANGKYRGMAPEADLIIVKVTSEGAPAHDGEPAEAAFNASYVAALEWVDEKIQLLGQPAVGLFNSGVQFGPIDGTSAVSRMIDEVFGSNRPGRVYVSPSGDAGGVPNHAAAAYDNSTETVVRLEKGNTGTSFMQAWYTGDKPAEVTVTFDDGTTVGPVGPGGFVDQDGIQIIQYEPGLEPGDFLQSTSGDRLALIIVTGHSGGGSVRLRGTTAGAGQFDLYAPIGGTALTFTDHLVPGRLTDFSATQSAIVVGAHVLRTSWLDLDGVPYDNSFEGLTDELWKGSSAGPTRDGRLFGVDVTTSGHNSFGASAPNSYFATFTGNLIGDGGGWYARFGATSGAAPVAVGAIALMLELGPNLTASQVRQILRDTAVTDAFTGPTPNADWGYGKLNVLAALDVIANPPIVEEVLVRGAGWSQSLLDFLESSGLGSATYGYSIPLGAANQLLPLPWHGIDRISMVFNENVNVALNHLQLAGSPALGFSVPVIGGFSYDEATRTATWELDGPLGANKYLIALDDLMVDMAGNALDGDNPAAPGSGVWGSLPSGDGVPGGDFLFRFNVLRGDVNQNGAVTTADVGLTRSRVGNAIGDAFYSILIDATANGAITTADVGFVRSRVGTTLPGGEPTSAVDPKAADAAFEALAARRFSVTSATQREKQPEYSRVAPRLRPGAPAEATPSISTVTTDEIHGARLHRELLQIPTEAEPEWLEPLATSLTALPRHSWHALGNSEPMRSYHGG